MLEIAEILENTENVILANISQGCSNNASKYNKSREPLEIL